MNKTKLETLQDALFVLWMKDTWDSNDYVEADRLKQEIATLEEEEESEQ